MSCASCGGLGTKTSHSIVRRRHRVRRRLPWARPPPALHGCCACGSSSNSARLFRLQSRLSDHPFGGLALVANEVREFLQSDPRRFDGTIDVHSLPEVAIIRTTSRDNFRRRGPPPAWEYREKAASGFCR